MNLFQRMIGRLFLGTKTVDLASLIDAAESQGWVSNSYGSRVKDGYKRNTTAYAATRKIVTNAAGIQWLLFREQPNEEEDEEITQHPILDLMHRPNPKQSQARFVEEMLTYLLVGGHSYIRKIKAESFTGRPSATALVNLRPDKVRTMKDGTYVYESGAPIPPEEILHLNLLDPADEDGGLSPIEVSSIQIDQGNNARLWNRNLLKQGGRPSGMIKSKMQMNSDQKEELLNSFLNRVAGAARAGLPIVASGELDWSPTGMSPGEMEWLQGMIHADRGVAVALGVPPQVLGDKDAATFSNYQEARKALYQETILPLLCWVQGEFTQFLLVNNGESDLYFKPDLDSVDALHEARRDEWSRVKEADWLTINEKRTATRYGAIDGEGGELIITGSGVVIREDGSVLLPSTLIPMETIDAALNEPEAPPPPAGTPPPGAPVPPAEDPAKDPAEDPAAQEDEGDQKPPPPASSGKFFSLITEDQKRAHWVGVESLRRAFVMVARVRAARIFQTERKRMVNAVKTAGTPDQITGIANGIVDGTRQAWEDYYLKTYSQTGVVFARRTHDDIVKGATMDDAERKAKATNIADRWLGHIQAVIVDESAEKIVGIGTTTVDKVKRIVQDTVDQGLGILDTAKAIDDLYLDDIIPNRSEVIARTEVVGASNKASHFAAEETGLKLNKEWIRTYDDRTRDTHRDVTEKAVPMSQPFNVGGSLLMYPGDSSLGADAGEIINCRCTIGYIPTE